MARNGVWNFLQDTERRGYKICPICKGKMPAHLGANGRVYHECPKDSFRITRR